MSVWTATVLTLFPEMFPGPLGHSLAGRALAAGHWNFSAIDIREFATDAHRTVDDAPFGGGPGMVMRADVVDAALADRIGKGRGDEESHRMAAKRIQFPWRWDSRTISTKLDVIREIL